jgi:hypothetical protein
VNLKPGLKTFVGFIVAMIGVALYYLFLVKVGITISGKLDVVYFLLLASVLNPGSYLVILGLRIAYGRTKNKLEGAMSPAENFEGRSKRNASPKFVRALFFTVVILVVIPFLVAFFGTFLGY